MKIRFPVIQNFSGADNHFKLLSRGLAARGMKTELKFYPHLLEFLPYHALRPWLRARSDCALIHSKAEYGWMFAEPGKPLVVKLAHSVFDPLYARQKKLAQRLYHNLKVHPSIARTLDLADRVVTVSRFSAQSIAERFGRRDVRVIYEGLVETFFRPAAQRTPPDSRPLRLLYTGNCIARKGFDLLAPILAALGEGFVLEYTSGLRTKATRPPHPSMVPLGKLTEEELLEAYQRCDIFLFPSRLEGFGRPVAEAMACGKPVICTDYSSLPELVDDGQGGYLCPRNDIEYFVDRIRHLAARPELRLRMGAHNRAQVEERFTLSRWVDDYLALYGELL